jgi:hypothetical protein
MGLGIYEEATPSSALSDSGDYTNPLTVALNGTTGASREVRLYVRNDGSPAGRWYSTVSVQPVVDSGEDPISGPLFTWKLIAGDTDPTEGAWSAVDGGNSISLSNIGSGGNEDTSTYLPFWLRIEIPKGAPVTSFDNVTLRITHTENLV